MSGAAKAAGILAIQGDFALHAQMLAAMGAPFRLVKHASEIEDVAGLILPGGESTTLLKFFARNGLGDAIRNFAARGNPVLGTCAGAILMAREVLNPPQPSLDLMDISIERNAYGRQIDSSIQQGYCPKIAAGPVEMVFIRAPIIRRIGPGVTVLGEAGGLPVLVEQENLLAATFHPELGGNPAIHRHFLSRLT